MSLMQVLCFVEFRPVCPLETPCPHCHQGYLLQLNSVFWGLLSVLPSSMLIQPNVSLLKFLSVLPPSILVSSLLVVFGISNQCCLMLRHPVGSC